MFPLVIDRITVPNDSMKSASDYYFEYVSFGGVRSYQEYIQLAESSIDGGARTALSEFIEQYPLEFIEQCRLSNEYWESNSAKEPSAKEPEIPESLRRRYLTDAAFFSLVNLLERVLIEKKLSVEDLHSAVKVAEYKIKLSEEL